MAKRIPQLNESDKARFWSRIDVRDLDECWPWLGAKFRNGYGQFWLAGYNVKASRVALTLEKEASGLCALHSCDNPPCCNPTHLRWGTDLENRTDAVIRGRTAKGEKHWHVIHPELTLKGSKHPRAKLTDECVMKIRLDPRTLLAIATEYQVAFQTVSRIKRRARWKHVL